MTINKYFEKWIAQDGWNEKTICEALNGDTTAAAKVWAEIATGEASVSDALQWVKHVAARIQENVRDGATSSQRERGALRAIGFYGRKDAYRDAKDCMYLLASFGPLDDTGKPLPTIKLTGIQWVAWLRCHGHLRDMSDKAAVNRVNEWRKELRIE